MSDFLFILGLLLSPVVRFFKKLFGIKDEDEQLPEEIQEFYDNLKDNL